MKSCVYVHFDDVDYKNGLRFEVPDGVDVKSFCNGLFSAIAARHRVTGYIDGISGKSKKSKMFPAEEDICFTVHEISEKRLSWLDLIDREEKKR